MIEDGTVATLKDIAAEIATNPALRVLFLSERFASADNFVNRIGHELNAQAPELVEKRNRYTLSVKGWDGRNPTVWAVSGRQAVAGLRVDLIVVEARYPGELPEHFNDLHRWRLTSGGRVVFFNWDGEKGAPCTSP